MASRAALFGKQRQNSAGSLLTLCVAAGAVLLALAWFGLRVPDWAVYAANPPAWISNATGLTEWGRRFFPGMDQGVAWLPQKLGLPVIGSLLVWFGLSFVTSGRFLGLVWALLGCVAFQFTMQRGYLAVAERYRATGQIQREAAACGKVLYIAEKTGSYGGFAEAGALFRFAARFTELQEHAAVRRMFPPAKPVHLRIGKIDITLETGHLPIPFPSSFTRHLRGLPSYRETLFEITGMVFPGVDVPLEVGDLGQMNIFDLRLYAGMQIASGLIVSLQPLRKAFPDETAQFLVAPAALRVYVHRSAEEVLDSFRGAARSMVQIPESNAVLVAYYDRLTRTLHVGVPEDASRKRTLAMLRHFAVSSTATWEDSKDDFWFSSEVLQIPLSHEALHFVSQNIPIFNGLPPALDEGLATMAEFASESISRAVVKSAAVMDRFSPPSVYRDRAREKKLAESAGLCPERMRKYWELLMDADRKHTLVPVQRLLALDPASLSEQADVALFYGEGWALALQVFLDRALFDRMRDALGRQSTSPERLAAEYQELWDKLDRQMLRAPGYLCAPC